MARFGQALKISKPPQQLSKALEPHNPPQHLSKACRLLGHGTSLGLTSCFYWASKLLCLLCGTFWAGLKSLKTSAAAFEGLGTSQPSAAAFEGVPLAWPWYLPRPHELFLLGFETASMWHVLRRASKPPQQLSKALEPHNPPQHLSKACRLLGHGTFLGLTSCFYWASKLLCGTFGQALKASKPPQQLSKALEPHNPPQQLSKASRLLGRGTSLGPTSCFYWASKLLCGTFGQALKASKPPQQLSKALEPHNPPQQLSKASRLLGRGTSLGPTSCFSWASKLLCGRFWAGLESLKTSAAAFEGLITSQPSAAAFEGVPLPWTWYLPRPHKLFLLRFETAMWHVVGRPYKPQMIKMLRSSFRSGSVPALPFSFTTVHVYLFNSELKGSELD